MRKLKMLAAAGALLLIDFWGICTWRPYAPSLSSMVSVYISSSLLLSLLLYLPLKKKSFRVQAGVSSAGLLLFAGLCIVYGVQIYDRLENIPWVWIGLSAVVSLLLNLFLYACLQSEDLSAFRIGNIAIVSALAVIVLWAVINGLFSENSHYGIYPSEVADGCAGLLLGLAVYTCLFRLSFWERYALSAGSISIGLIVYWVLLSIQNKEFCIGDGIQFLPLILLLHLLLCGHFSRQPVSKQCMAMPYVAVGLFHLTVIAVGIVQESQTPNLLFSNTGFFSWYVVPGGVLLILLLLYPLLTRFTPEGRWGLSVPVSAGLMISAGILAHWHYPDTRFGIFLVIWLLVLALNGLQYAILAFWNRLSAEG